MTDTLADPRLADMVARLEALERAAPTPATAPTQLANGLPPTVAAGELITSAWGNTVVDCLSRKTRFTESRGGAVLNLTANNQAAVFSGTTLTASTYDTVIRVDLALDVAITAGQALLTLQDINNAPVGQAETYVSGMMYCSWVTTVPGGANAYAYAILRSVSGTVVTNGNTAMNLLRITSTW